MKAKKYNPPETAPTDRRILVRIGDGEDAEWFAATWMQHISSDSVMWVIVQSEQKDAFLKESAFFYVFCSKIA